MNKSTLSLIVIDDDLEALALRAALEWWQVQVTMHFIGKAQDVVDVFSDGNLSPHVCIAAHGIDKDGQWGFGLPELADEIAKEQLYNKLLLPSDVSRFVKLRGQNVLSLACSTGTKEMAEAFLKKGAGSYVGPPDAQFGSASLYFALSYYYWLFAKKKSVKEAFDNAAALMDKKGDRFELFRR